MLTRLKKFSQLPNSLKYAWLEAWFTFIKFDVLVSFVPYQKWRNKIKIANQQTQLPNEQAVLQPSQELNQKPNQELNQNLSQVKALIKLSESAGRFHLRKMNCLRRCLTQQQLLAKRQFPTKMHIGIKLENGNVSAHSWLTYNKVVINDTDDVTERYSELKAVDQHSVLSSLK